MAAIDAELKSGVTSDGESLDISVVLPVFNEEGHVREEIERIRRGLEASRYSFEIIVIDDGSADGSTEILRQMEGIRLIELGRNHGSGYSRKIGSRAARGEIVVWTDADMTYPNHEIAQLVDQFEPGYEQVVGARRREAGTHRWARRPAKWFLRKLAGYLVRTKIPDLNSGFRAYRREVGTPYLKYLPQGFSCVTTMTLSFLANGHYIKYVDIDYEERAGRSKFHWWRDTTQYLLQIIRMIMTYNPLRVFIPIGSVLMFTAVGKVMYDIFDKSFRITSNAIILTIVSFQVLAIGLLADLVSRLGGTDD
jgi:glycosyltransferase involved in cell wall biosynthesis